MANLRTGVCTRRACTDDAIEVFQEGLRVCAECDGDPSELRSALIDLERFRRGVRAIVQGVGGRTALAPFFCIEPLWSLPERGGWTKP
jgi:hypothetical protein